MNPNNRKARLLLKKYLQGECTPEEIDLLHQWYDHLPDLTPVGEIDRSSLEEQLRRATWDKITAGQAPVRRLVWRIPAAAAVIGILAFSTLFWFYRSHRYHEFDNATTGVRSMVLPDGTSVWLNAHSRLRWKDDPDAVTRTVELDGEGYFDVAKNASRPFIVRSNGVATQVLGTSFNIEGYSGEPHVRIALVRGSVKVWRQDGHHAAVRLQPGQIAQVEAGEHGTVDVQTGDAASYAGWTGGGFVLQDVPLEDALQRLCHRYGYTLKATIRKDRHKPITAAYHDDSFQEILTGLLYINHLNYSIQDSVITVY